MSVNIHNFFYFKKTQNSGDFTIILINTLSNTQSSTQRRSILCLSPNDYKIQKTVFTPKFASLSSKCT